MKIKILCESMLRNNLVVNGEQDRFLRPYIIATRECNQSQRENATNRIIATRACNQSHHRNKRMQPIALRCLIARV